jgi:hypothetical protein
MRNQPQNPVSTDEVLRRIKLEIVRRDSEDDAEDAVGTDGPAGYIPRINIGPADLPLRRNYSCAEFTQFHDARFIENATRNILGRLGGQAYLGALRNGSLTKIDILGRLRYSSEGRRRGVTISGLLPMFLLHTLFKVPVVGYFCEVLYQFFRLPRLAQNQRMLEQLLADANHDLALQINNSLDSTEQAINRNNR